jgi:hypothetical protein
MKNILDIIKNFYWKNPEITLLSFGFFIGFIVGVIL